MSWFLIDSETDSSLSIVHEKNLLKSGQPIQVEENVDFFYRGKKCSGVVLAMNRDRDVLDAELTTRMKAAKAAKVQPSRDVASSEPVSSKRKSTPTTFYNSTTNPEKKRQTGAPQMSQSEKSRQRVLALNIAEANRRANADVFAKASKVKDTNDGSDSDWVPSEGNEVINPKDNKKKVKAKKVQNQLLKQILNGQSSDSDSSEEAEEKSSRKQGTSPPGSPSREELMKQIELLHKQLQKKGNSETSSRNRDSSDSSSKVQEPQVSIRTKVQTKDSSNQFEKNAENEFNSSFLENGDAASKEDNQDGPDSFNLSDLNKNDDIPDLDLAVVANDLSHQLYGKQDDTQELCYGIYCKKMALTNAITGSHNVNHMFRRLMSGVFIPKEILNCTVTGQSWHAGGDEHKNADKEALHPTALTAIVDFSNSVAKKKKWATRKMDKAKKIFAVRLTEIKNQYKSKTKK